MSFFYTYNVITALYFYEVTQEFDHDRGLLFFKSLIITKYSQITLNDLIYLFTQQK